MNILNNLTLGKKITLLTITVLAVGIGVFGFLSIRAVNQATEAMLQDRLTTAQLVADYVDEALRRALIELNSTAQKIELGKGNGGLDIQVRQLEDILSRLSMITNGIFLVNRQGDIIWSKPQPSPLQSFNTQLYPNIGQAMEKRTSIISGLVSALITDTPVVLIASPVDSGSGALVVAVDLSRSGIGGFVQPIRLGTTGYVEIIDQNGVVVARTEPGPRLVPFERSDHSGRFAELIAEGKPARGLCHTCHEPVYKVERRDILAFIPLSEARWGVIIRQSEEEAMAPVHDLRRNLIAFGLGFIVVTLLCIMVITRDVVERIKALRHASQRIAGGDLVSPVAGLRKDDIGILAESFEDMRAKLNTSYGELEQATKDVSSVLAVSEILASLSDLSNLDNALDNALEKTLDAINESRGSILLYDEEKQILECRVNRGLYRDENLPVILKTGEGIAGQAAMRRETIWVEDISACPDITNHNLITTADIKAFASIPLYSKDKILGVLNIASPQVNKFSAHDIRLLEGIARHISTAIENARLHQEVQYKEKVRGELLQDIFSIQEEERKRIARELHDETCQVVSSLTASLEVLKGSLQTNPEKVAAIIKKAQTMSVGILDDIHKLIYELRPSLLDDWGLKAAIKWLIESNLEAQGIKVSFTTTGRARRLDSQIETVLFRVIQEAIHNIIRHAEASMVNISLNFSSNLIKAGIRDDGKGFNFVEAISSKNRPRGLGLLGMKERVEIVHGTLRIESRPDGGGTEINIEIPLRKEVSHGKN